MCAEEGFVELSPLAPCAGFVFTPGKIRLHAKASALIKDPQTEDGPRGAQGGQGGDGEGETLKGTRANRRRGSRGRGAAARMKI